MGLSDLTLAGFVRVVTHPKIFRDPTPADDALRFADAVRSAPAALHVSPGPRVWSIFEELVTAAEARGNLIPDALIAAMAIEQGATLITADRGFARWPGLDVEHPIEA